MKVLRTSVNDAEFERLDQFCKEKGLSMYALVKNAVFEYVESERPHSRRIRTLDDVDDERYEKIVQLFKEIRSMPQKEFDTFIAESEKVIRQADSGDTPHKKT